MSHRGTTCGRTATVSLEGDFARFPLLSTYAG